MKGLLALLLTVPLALGAGPTASNLHSYMSDKELHFYFGQTEPSDYEVIIVSTIHPAVPNLPQTLNHRGAQHDKPSILKFTALGKDYTLNLLPNRQLLAPYAVVGKRGAVQPTPANDSSTEEHSEEKIYHGMDEKNIAGHEEDHNNKDMSMDELLMDWDRSLDANCQYLHEGDDLVASISLCDGEAHGLVLSPTHSLEIMPLNPRLKRMMNLWTEEYNNTLEGELRTREPRNYHIAKRSAKHETRPYLDKVKELFLDQDNSYDDEKEFDRNINITERKKRGGAGEKVIETALFLDSAAYRRFKSYFTSIGESDYDSSIRRLVLGYMNGIQALYLLPSLRHTVRFTVVRLELWESDPSSFYHYQGEREKILNSFCEYQHKLNAKADSNPGFWDLALYVSGMNFWAMDSKGRRNGVTMGLARVGGMCRPEHACVVGELGVTTDTGKPYPSAGFTSVYVMAHEIGHSLGMSHDHKEGCERNGYIMSESRGTKGESQWSQCSVNSLSNGISSGQLSCLDDDNGKKAETLGMEKDTYPGEVWDADAQCKIFLLDNDARIDHTDSNIKDVCYSIKCRTPQRQGYYRAGPALEGTACGAGMWCMHGTCVKNTKPTKQDEPGTWSDWSYTSCQSGCTPESKGYRTKRRTCQRGRLIHTVAGCKGPTTGMDFCDDSKICSSRKDADTYASEQCKIFSSYVTGIDSQSPGGQVGYSTKFEWQSCAIYCKRSDTGQWYTPRLELNDMPWLSPYFPDGTFCHQAGSTKFYCQKNTCIEEDARFGKADTPELNLLFNAAPKGDEDRESLKQLEKYFTLDKDMNPVGGKFAGIKGKEEDETGWDVIDYIE